jgi:hypothetical protein
LSRSVEEGRFDQQPTTRVCPGSFFEPDFPREEGGKIIRSFDYAEAYARHHADSNWLSPFHRRLFKLYWFIQSNLSCSRGNRTNTDVIRIHKNIGKLKE